MPEKLYVSRFQGKKLKQEPVSLVGNPEKVVQRLQSEVPHSELIGLIG